MGAASPARWQRRGRGGGERRGGGIGWIGSRRLPCTPGSGRDRGAWRACRRVPRFGEHGGRRPQHRQKALDEFGRLDIVVTAAGILRDRMIFNMTEQEWDDVIAVHLKGTFSVVQPAARFSGSRTAGESSCSVPCRACTASPANRTTAPRRMPSPDLRGC